MSVHGAAQKRIEDLERELAEATEVGIKQIETIQFLYAENKKQRKAIEDVIVLVECSGYWYHKTKTLSILREAIEDAEHAQDCASRRSIMVGGYSSSLDTPPNAHAHFLDCNCFKSEVTE